MNVAQAGSLGFLITCREYEADERHRGERPIEIPCDVSIYLGVILSKILILPSLAFPEVQSRLPISVRNDINKLDRVALIPPPVFIFELVSRG